MECRVEKNEHFPHLLIYEFNRGSKTTEAVRNICAVYGEDSIAEKAAQKWIARFKQGNYDKSDISRSGRPCCASGRIWKGLSIMNCLRGT
jgi:hypothetical protein